jgi:hypothetical protein
MGIRMSFCVMGGFAMGMAACASWAPPPDYRGRTARVGAEPRPLLAGPARLLHVNADRRTEFTLYRVRAQEGKPVDCGGARRDAVIDLDQGAVIWVGKDETICVVAQSSTQVSWHAKPVTGDVGTQHASLDRD